MTTSTVPVTGDQKWPKEAEDTYERVRPLGKGAFGLVWLAKARDSKKADDLVAIKFIHIGSAVEHSYADREIAILSELRHPNVIRLVRAYDPSGDSRLVVMSLAAGPDVGKLIETGGALSLPLCRLLARHLVSAVSYLHGRGVVHRDIKPDNCILVRAEGSGASSESSGTDDILADDSLWDQRSKDTEDYAPRYKIVLVDFGFARALTPADVDQKSNGSVKRQDSRSLGPRRTSLISQRLDLTGLDLTGHSNNGNLDLTGHSNLDFTNHSNYLPKDMAPPPPQELGRRRRSSVFRSARRRESVARRPIRAMSAIGTKAFAAPEVILSREKTEADENKAANGGGGISALTETVSDYGMISDAYSVGVTLKMALTGAPANVPNLSDWIRWQNQNQPSEGGGCGCFGKAKDVEKDPAEPRRRRFRHDFQVPKDINGFVQDLMNPKTEERLTVRQAQLHPWVCGRDDEAHYVLPHGDIPAKHGDPIVFLKCILDEKN